MPRLYQKREAWCKSDKVMLTVCGRPLRGKTGSAVVAILNWASVEIFNGTNLLANFNNIGAILANVEHLWRKTGSATVAILNFASRPYYHDYVGRYWKKVRWKSEYFCSFWSIYEQVIFNSKISHKFVKNWNLALKRSLWPSGECGASFWPKKENLSRGPPSFDAKIRFSVFGENVGNILALKNWVWRTDGKTQLCRNWNPSRN